MDIIVGVQKVVSDGMPRGPDLLSMSKKRNEKVITFAVNSNTENR
jgi:hypothetical protein